jgi:hypothetical protein
MARSDGICVIVGSVIELLCIYFNNTGIIKYIIYSAT